MSDAPRYGFTPRGFATATLATSRGKTIEVQQSSAIAGGRGPAGCLRDDTGDPLPGSSFLWLTIGEAGERPDSDELAGHMGALDREEVAWLVGLMVRWLATGHIQPEGTR